MSFKTLLSIAFISSFCTLASAQSGWTKQKNELYAQLSYSQFQSDQFYTTTGTFFETNEFIQKTATLYAEYGITDRFTSIVNYNFFQANRYENTLSATGTGNLKLEFKYALSKKLPISISVAPEIPIGKEDNFVREKEINDFGFFNVINLPTTDGEFNVWSTIAGSTTFLNNKGWSSLYFSHNYRTKEFSNQFKSGLEIGYKPIDKLYFKTTFSILSNFTDEPNSGVSFIRGEGTRNTSFSVGAGYNVYKNWGIIAEYYRGINAIVDPKNTYLGPLVTAGITFELKPKKENTAKQ